MPVLRDLIIDRSIIDAQLGLTNAEVQIEGDIDIDQLPRNDYEFWWQDLHRKNMCRECGLCFSVCPAFQEGSQHYAGPAALSQVYLRAFDGLDVSDRISQAVSLGVLNCTLCGECNKVCPSYIDHVECNQRLQDVARERGLAASKG
jgi:succinate dehydrogenase/fumarate reductase-like Fe-S protein